MRPFLLLALTVLSALSASAQSTSVRFSPPAPDSRSAITARLGGMWPDSGYPRCSSVSVTGRTIIITTDCVPQGVLPAVSPWELDAYIGRLEAGIYDVQVTLPSSPTPRVIARAQLIVQEGDPAFSVEPNVAALFVEQNVVLKSPALECRDTAACLPPTVHFGDRMATILNIAGDTWVVRAPNQAPGTVDITVQQGHRVLRRVAAFHYPSLDAPPAPEFFAPVLFPVVFAGAGAAGSEWETELAAHNGNAYVFFTMFPSVFEWCPVCDPAPPLGIAPHGSALLSARTARLSYPSGQLSFFPRSALEKMHFGLLVRDLSRQSEALGAEVPVVREEEWFEDSFGLMNVPADSGNRFRTALRIYTMEGLGTFAIRIRPMDSATYLVDTHATTQRVGDSQMGALVINDLISRYPALAGQGPLRIEINAVSPGALRVWGFASTTNNQTQHVTVISPQ